MNKLLPVGLFLLALMAQRPLLAHNSTTAPALVNVAGYTAQVINFGSSVYGLYYLFLVKNTEAIAWENLGLAVVITLLNAPYVFYVDDPLITIGAVWGAICLSVTIYAKYLFSGRVHRVDAAMQTEV